MKNPILVPELRELLREKKYRILKGFLEEGHPKEIAEYLSLLTPEEIWRILEVTDVHSRTAIFNYFDMDVQVQLVSGEQRRHITELLKELPPDNRADLFQHLDAEMADRILVYLPVSERTDVIRLTSYHEDTAGAIMTTDFATLNENDTVENAIKKIRKMAPSKETIYYIYVSDDEGKLIGFVSLRKLIISRPKQNISKIMQRDIIYAHVHDDQEQAAQLIEEYNLIALPVVDVKNKMAGIITYDDAMDVIREEQTEDLEKFMAISGGVEEKSYLELSALTHFKKRVFWVVVLGLFGLVTGLIIEGFKNTLQALIVLTFYMPLLNAAGGNTGSQSATVILRSLALNELSPSDIWAVVKKEMLVSVLLSVCLGLVTFVRVYVLSDSTAVTGNFTLFSVAGVIGLSLTLQVIWSTIFGAIIPLFATRMNIDPALVSSPLLTTFVDMGGIVIYFSVAKIILGI